MTATLTPQTSAGYVASDTGALSAIRIPAVAWAAVVIALLWITYAFLGQDVAPGLWNFMHEFFHDGRHFLGIACH